MPYTITPGDLIQLSFDGLLFGQQAMTTTVWRLDGDVAYTDGAQFLRDVMDNIQAAGKLYAKYLAAITDSFNNIKLVAQVIKPTRYAYQVDADALSEGVFPGVSSTANVNAVITRRGIGTTRHDRGNLHIPGSPDDGFTAGLLGGAYKVALEDLAEQFATPIEMGLTSALTPVLYNNVEPTFSISVTDAFVQPTARIMRRRTVGVGS